MNSPLLALASATMVAVTAYAGGWATVTVKHMPEYLVVANRRNCAFSFVSTASHRSMD